MTRIVLFRYLLICLLACTGNRLLAQAPDLPDIIAASDKGVNVISWNCQYDGLKSIAVQRSSDSIFNYVTIGYVKNLKKGTQAFIDGHPNAGANWYRLYIAFSSDLTWYSNNIKVVVDSATLLKKGVIPPNDSLQKYASTVNIAPEDIIASSMDATNAANSALPATNRPDVGNNAVSPKTAPKLSLNIPEANDVDQFTYIKSRHVFTNPFTGHVTLELPEDMREPYAIEFFKQGDEKTAVLDVPRIRKNKVVIDKRNFQGKGMYKFILYKGKNKLEEGYISIF